MEIDYFYFLRYEKLIAQSYVNFISMDLETNKKSRLKVFLENPSKALWSLAIPIMFGMGIQTCYNLVDMIFIGKLVTLTTAALHLICLFSFWYSD